jgi:hypothetical protein
VANSFDDIEIHRPDVARGYLSLLRSQPGRPLALFAPRRVGKTFFLSEDLAPVARRAGFLPVYADVWLHRAAPLRAVNHALEEALDDALVPKSAVRRAARTPVSKVGAFGASLELGEEPRRRGLPADAGPRLDALVARLAAAADRPLLLMLDEIQALADAPGGGDAMAALRAVLQKRKRAVVAVFTGSSQDALASMIAASGGPMYQFAQLIDFPLLGDELLEPLAARYAQVHRGQKLDLVKLRAAFDRIGRKPALMKDLVKSMSAEGETEPDRALKTMLRDERYVAGWRAQIEALGLLERALLRRIAAGEAPFAADTLRALRLERVDVTPSKARTAVQRLKDAGLVRGSREGYMLDDELLGDYLRGKA